MSRTDDLRGQGAAERGGGGGGPFVKWGQEYSWVEGHVTGFWSGQYGDVAVLTVTKASDGLEAEGKDEGGQKYREPVKRGHEVNVGLNSAALQGRLTPEDQGKHFHIAFEGWGETKAGQQFRHFAVLELPEQPQPMPQGAALGGGPGAPGEEGPPISDYDDDLDVF